MQNGSPVSCCISKEPAPLLMGVRNYTGRFSLWRFCDFTSGVD